MNELSPAEDARIAEFYAAPYPAEVLREKVAQAMEDEQDIWLPKVRWLALADAALAVMAQQPHPAVQRVEALARELEVAKWTEWRADDAADAIRAALAGNPR